MPPLTLPPVPQAAAPQGTEAGTIIFSVTAGLLLAAAFLWALGRIGASRGKTINLPAGFAAGAAIFTLIYAFNRMGLAHWPKTVAAADLLLLAVALAMPALRQGRRFLRLREAKARRDGHEPAGSGLFSKVMKRPLSPGELRLKIEVANLENMLKIDPGSTCCLEKLSELYEKLGKRKMALDAARAAARQDPTVRNKWRVAELRERLGKRK